MDIVLKELHYSRGDQVKTSDLLELFMHVSRCWSNAQLAITERMSVERALDILREVRDEAFQRKQHALSQRAHALLWNIVNNQATPTDKDGDLIHIGTPVDQIQIDQVATVRGVM